MKCAITAGALLLVVASAHAQIQVELKFKRLQYVSYEPVIATLTITNLAGRDVDLHDDAGQHWFGFEVSGREGQPIAPSDAGAGEPDLHIPASQTVTRKINLTPLYPVHDLGTYRVRANVYFSDLGKFYYSPTKVFEVTNARPIWEKTVGLPEGFSGEGNVRTYSLLTNRFPDHTSLYVRVEDKDSSAVYATYPIGRLIEVEEPQVELDRANQLHVLQCSAPRAWTYSHIGLDGELYKQQTFLETKSRPRLVRASSGDIAVNGGMLDEPAVASAKKDLPKLSARPKTPLHQE